MKNLRWKCVSENTEKMLIKKRRWKWFPWKALFISSLPKTGNTSCPIKWQNRTWDKEAGKIISETKESGTNIVESNENQNEKWNIWKKYCLFVLCCLSIPQLRSRLVIEMERGLGADAFITLLEASALLSRKKKQIWRGKVELLMCASQKKQTRFHAIAIKQVWGRGRIS